MAETGHFGDIVFEASADAVKTWDRLRRSRQARFASHDVAQGKARLEFTGVELQEINLEVRLDARFVNPAREARALDDALEAGEPRPLVLGGTPLGKYVLRDVSERVERTDGQGRIMVSVLKLRFKEYN